MGYWRVAAAKNSVHSQKNKIKKTPHITQQVSTQEDLWGMFPTAEGVPALSPFLWFKQLPWSVWLCGTFYLPLVISLWFKLTSSVSGLWTNHDIFMHIWHQSCTKQPESSVVYWKEKTNRHGGLLCRLQWPKIFRLKRKKIEEQNKENGI